MGGSTTVQAPQPINPAQVGAESLQTQITLAPQQFAAEAQFAPQYAQLYQGIMRDVLLGTEGRPGLLQTYSQAAPAISDLQAQLNLAQRRADIGDVERLGPQAVQAFQQANPQLMALQQRATERALGGADVISPLGAAPTISAGQNPLIELMGQQAAQGLMAGGQLSPYETARIAGQVAEQYGTMGRAQDPIATATAALQLDAAQRARQQAAQQYAGQVAGAMAQQQQLGMAAQEATGRLGLGFGTADQEAQLRNEMIRQQALGQAAGIAGSTAQDPFALILGRSGGVGQIAGLSGQAGAFPTASRAFDPFNQSIMDIYAGNQANQLAANVATANARAARTAGIVGGLGSAAGGLFGGAGQAGGFGNLFCWVAREVYGETNPKWMAFRDWLLTRAPRWFKWLYFKYGERFAAFIRNKPRLKKFIRKWMDKRVALMEGA